MLSPRCLEYSRRCSRVVRNIAGAVPALPGIWQALFPRCPGYGRRCSRVAQDMAGDVPALSGIWQALSRVVREMAGAIPTLSGTGIKFTHMLLFQLFSNMSKLPGIWQALFPHCPGYGRRRSRVAQDMAGAVPPLSAIWQALSRVVRDMAGAMPALSGIWQALSLRCPRYGRRCPCVVRDMAGAIPALSRTGIKFTHMLLFQLFANMSKSIPGLSFC